MSNAPVASQEARSAEKGAKRRYRTGPESLRLKILNEVMVRYPCMAVPPGFQTEMARKHGVSRARVSQIMKATGVKQAWPSRKRKCRECDAEPPKRRQYCSEHATVPVSCPSCGTIVRMERWMFLRRLIQTEEVRAKRGSTPQQNPNSTRFFCKRTCRKERGISLIKDNPDLDIEQVAEIMDVSKKAVRLWLQEIEKNG